MSRRTLSRALAFVPALAAGTAVAGPSPAPDRSRLHWLDHPGLRATELRLAADLSVIVGTRLPGQARHRGGR
jgi:hypothetical protein